MLMRKHYRINNILMANYLPFDLNQYTNYTDYEKDYFTKLYEQLIQKKTIFEDIQRLQDNQVINYSDLPSPTQEEAKSILSKVAICHLNGGLGTSMGLHIPKAVIPVRNNQSFLDISLTQLQVIQEQYNVTIPLLLLTSPHTEKETQAILNHYKLKQIRLFSQNSFPRLQSNTFLPLQATEIFPKQQLLYPPGHGSLYMYLYYSGELDALLEQGKEYLFISNIDNLAAPLDLSILSYIVENKVPFLMEATRKTKNDLKGGSLASTKDGRPILIETGQIPKHRQEEFKNIQVFKHFNTNNIWLHLPSLKERFLANQINLPLITNTKTIAQQSIIQLETAIGSAVTCFDNSVILDVPRTRFLPVKNTSDLLLIQSNLFTLEQGLLKINPERMFPDLPLVHLGKHFHSFDDYQRRIPIIPNLLSLLSLTMIGDISFQGEACLQGNVIILPQQGKHMMIPHQATFNNQVVTGECIITDL